jgi:hypothetical protein
LHNEKQNVSEFSLFLLLNPAESSQIIIEINLQCLTHPETSKPSKFPFDFSSKNSKNNRKKLFVVFIFSRKSLKMQSILSAKYYAKPDGEDYIGKMCATNRYAIQAALGAATMDVVMYTHPKGYLPTIARFAWWLGPAVGMASAFTTGTFMANRIRGKDDK